MLEAKRPKASESADLVGDADPAQVLLLRPGSALVTSITPKSQHRPSPVCLRSRLRAGLQDFPNTLPTISFADQKQVHGIDFNIPSKLDFRRLLASSGLGQCLCVGLRPISALVAQLQNLISKSRLESYLGNRAGDKEIVVAAGASASSSSCLAAPPPSSAPVPATVSASASPSAGPPAEVAPGSVSLLAAAPADITGDAVEAT